jgi:hypothetical protein
MPPAEVHDPVGFAMSDGATAVIGVIIRSTRANSTAHRHSSVSRVAIASA